jgi:predicted small metal-binding protein
MAFTFACKDAGVDCAYVAQGETMDEVMAEAAEHAKAVHGYTDEQLNDPKMMETMKELVKQS